jgi:two-component system, chemotaxis family, response regulator Rcp1
LDYSGGFIHAKSTPAAVSAWLFAGESWNDIPAAFGSNRSQDKDQPSSSRSRSEALSRKWRILVIEDNNPDVFLIREAIDAAGIDADVRVIRDGLQATRFLNGLEGRDTAPCPDLVLLDLNLPKESGEEVLRYMRDSSKCKNAPVLVVTSSDSETELEAMKALGASGYFQKPSDYNEFMKLGALVRALLNRGRRGQI